MMNEKILDNISPEITDSGHEAAQTLASRAVHWLSEKKALDIKMVRVDKQTIIADYFVIASGTSTTHIKSLADELEFRLGEEGYSPTRIDGVNNDSWVLMDYGCVLIHIFKTDTREFYKLEKLWGEGDIKDIRHILIPEADK